jgi:DNA-binding HxlR family transcriptional regulator
MLYQRLRERPRGLGELRRAMPRITTRVLKAQLRELEADGIISRRELTHVRPGVRFQITAYGRTLGPILEVLWKWGRKHLDRPTAGLGTRIRSPAP